MGKSSPESEDAISLAQSRSVSCLRCGQGFEAECWLIVDSSQRPDLLSRIREGTLNAIACPYCGPGQLDGPLPVYRADSLPGLGETCNLRPPEPKITGSNPVGDTR